MLTGPKNEITDEMLIAYMNNAPMRKKILENLSVEDQLELLSEMGRLDEVGDVGTAIGAPIGKVATAAKKAVAGSWKAVKDAAIKAVKIVGHSILITVFPWMKPEYDRILSGGKTSNQLRDKIASVYREYERALGGSPGGSSGAGNFKRNEHNWAFAMAPVAFLAQSGYAREQPKKSGVLMRPLVDEDPDGEVVKELDALIGAKNESVHQRNLSDIFLLQEEEIIDADSRFGTLEKWLAWSKVQNAVDKDRDARQLRDLAEKNMRQFVMEDLMEQGAKVAQTGSVKEVMEKAGGYDQFLKIIKSQQQLRDALAGKVFNEEELVEDEWDLANLQGFLLICWLVVCNRAMLENSGLDNPEGTEYGRVLKGIFDEAINKAG